MAPRAVRFLSHNVRKRNRGQQPRRELTHEEVVERQREKKASSRLSEQCNDAKRGHGRDWRDKKKHSDWIVAVDITLDQAPDAD